MNTYTDRVLLTATRKRDTTVGRSHGATDPVLFEWRGDTVPDQPTIDKTIEALLQLPGVVSVREKVERAHERPREATRGRRGLGCATSCALPLPQLTPSAPNWRSKA